ncbi:21847_t:CDS:2 [Entrophospora sp. SA101]|nr:21847_t:CDS:2 [Entrophospora sp. SA101]
MVQCWLDGFTNVSYQLRAFSSRAIGYRVMQNHSNIGSYFPGIPDSNIIHVLIYPVSESEPAPATTLKTRGASCAIYVELMGFQHGQRGNIKVYQPDLSQEYLNI